MLKTPQLGPSVASTTRPTTTGAPLGTALRPTGSSSAASWPPVCRPLRLSLCSKRSDWRARPIFDSTAGAGPTAEAFTATLRTGGGRDGASRRPAEGCHGNGPDHCCYLPDSGELCPFLEEWTVAGRRWACRLRRELGSWRAVHADSRYKRVVHYPSGYTGGTSCGTWRVEGVCCFGEW
jgi:hypothetical protein